MKKINGLLHKSIFLILIIGFISCGEGVVEIGQNTYSSKIVIEGYIFPGQKVKNIRITRNFPLNTRLDLNSLLIKNAIVTITDNQTNKIYSLSFNPSSLSYEYTGNDLIIDYDKSYSLSVQTTIDGKQLTANSTTRVPKKGFKILKEESILDSMKYREPDENGNVKQFKVVFRPSLDTDFYGISIVALDAKIESFIYNNPFIEVKQEDLKKDFDRYKYQSKRLQNIKSDVPKINYNVDWLDTWFYGSYRLIIYAGDENYKLFYITYRNVQEFDGNFHEPRININGDGIGVFCSVIADTVHFKVLK